MSRSAKNHITVIPRTCSNDPGAFLDETNTFRESNDITELKTMSSGVRAGGI